MPFEIRADRVKGRPSRLIVSVDMSNATELWAWVEKIAETNHVSKGEVVRQCIEYCMEV